MSPPRPRPTPTRLALGFALAPLAVPLAHAALELARPIEGPDAYVQEVVRDGLVTAVAWTMPLSYALALSVGIPLVLALRATGRLSAPWIVAGAALAGGAATTLVVLALLRAGGGGVPGGFGAVPAAGAALSAVVGAVFCALARVPLRRRDGPPPARA